MHGGDRSRSRRTPLVWAGGLTGLLLAGAFFPVAALRDAETWAAVPDARLRLSPAFLAFAPVNNTLDALSLLSVREHVGLWVLGACIYLAWRLWRATRPGRRGGWRQEVGLAAGTLGALFTVYAFGALVPRPMAALTLAGPDSSLVIIDVHSHTSASHDGRPGFTAERNRQWHAAAGFDVAYISDHFTFRGAEAGLRINPLRADDGTVLLSAIECLEDGRHVNVLGVTAADYQLFTGRYLATSFIESAVAAGRPRPLLVQTIPAPLDRVPRPGMPGLTPVAAIELSDAAPRGLGQLDRDHSRVLHLADSLGLTVVAGSDNHGWGRTAAAWTVLSVPGWRALAPADLGRQIDNAIRSRGRRAARVIERTRPVWSAPFATRGLAAWTDAATGECRFVGQFFWQLTATRCWAERAAWLVWAWTLALLASWRRKTA